MRRLRREAVSADPTFGFFLHGWALQALTTVARGDAGDMPPGPRAGGLSPRRIARATDFMIAHLACGVLLADVAAAADLSPRHFLRAFRQSPGRTPLKFLRDLRVERAKRLLSQGDDSLTEIAHRCGIQPPPAFSNTFRSETGMTPGAFRLSCG